MGKLVIVGCPRHRRGSSHKHHPYTERENFADCELGRGTSNLMRGWNQLPWVDATAITEPTCEKIVLMLDATPGIRAPAVTATKPAINAYSMRS
jgi:hypothetical protein